MTVSELMTVLSGFDCDRIVVLAKDSEGNSYSPVHGAWPAAYRAEASWYGTVGLEVLDEESRAQGYGDEDVITDGQPAVILTPIH